MYMYIYACRDVWMNLHCLSVCRHIYSRLYLLHMIGCGTAQGIQYKCVGRLYVGMAQTHLSIW